MKTLWKVSFSTLQMYGINEEGFSFLKSGGRIGDCD
jgi:hypothetical protein